MITYERLRELLHYDPITGVFRRLTRGQGIVKGALAGASRTKGNRYARLRVDGKYYQAHRLAWLYMTSEWPKAEIDHINRDGYDNRFVNLREATRGENQANTPVRRDNKIGLKGVYFDERKNLYRATIRRAGRRHYLGSFKEPAAAAAAFAAASLTVVSDHGEGRES